jgi:hypothetical protein
VFLRENRVELILKPEQVAYPHGLSITVEGFSGDIGHEVPSQVFMEVYEGKLRVHVWNGGESPTSTTEIQWLQEITDGQC